MSDARGLHQQREADINQPTLATVLANPGVNLDALRPYKGYNSIRETDNVASSTYNSLQVCLEQALLQRIAVWRRVYAQQEHGRRLEPARHHSKYL